MKRYVQHQSGQGRKWRVIAEHTCRWEIGDKHLDTFLPKEEYKLCSPPSCKLVDVTHEIGIDAKGRLYHFYDQVRHYMDQEDYLFLAASPPESGIRVNLRVDDLT